jgi:5-methylcytosine-specific restriction protein A
MPRKPSTPCTHPTCSELVPGGGRCPDHRQAFERNRGSAAARGYGPKWKLIRGSYLKRHSTCVDCGAPATEADHAPVSRRALVAAGVEHPDADEHLQARCRPCHSRRGALEEHTFGRDPSWGVRF